MGKDARNEDLDLRPEVKEKLSELVALLAAHGFGDQGPRLETTFAQIEQFGHQAGRMVARALDERLVEQHAAHFQNEQPCPTCGETCPPKESPHDLSLQTADGEVTVGEPSCRCSPCRRDFFPGTHIVAD